MHSFIRRAAREKKTRNRHVSSPQTHTPKTQTQVAILLSGPGVQRWLNIAPGSLLALYPPLSLQVGQTDQILVAAMVAISPSHGSVHPPSSFSVLGKAKPLDFYYAHRRLTSFDQTNKIRNARRWRQRLLRPRRSGG